MKTFYSTTTLSVNDNSECKAYFEIYILAAGNQEDISIGLLGTGVIYYGSNGNIFRSGHFVGIGPRFGSYDTVGVGLHDNKVFFTYNGLLIRPLIPCYVAYPVKAIISTASSGYFNINVKTSNWMFQPGGNSDSCRNDSIDELLAIIQKKINKLCCNKENKYEDLYEKHLELLSLLKKNEMIEEIQAKKIKFAK